MDFAKLLRERAYKTGDFTLASGKKSTEYLDVKTVLHDPAVCRAIVSALIELLPDVHTVNVVAGVATGGIALATVMAHVMHARLHAHPVYQLTVRQGFRDPGTTTPVDGLDNLRGLPRVRAVLVEDVLTTGASAVSAACALKATLEAAGHNDYAITDVLAVVDREEGGMDNVSRFQPGTRVSVLTTLSVVRDAG